MNTLQSEQIKKLEQNAIAKLKEFKVLNQLLKHWQNELKKNQGSLRHFVQGEFNIANEKAWRAQERYEKALALYERAKAAAKKNKTR